MSKLQTQALLLEQFEISWALAWYHLETLTTAECLWRPADPCLHVSALDAGGWRPDWPESEGYEIGPPSIAWTTWHITYWWEKAIAHLADDEHVDAGDMSWPGTAEEVRANIVALKDRWRVTIESYDEAAFSTAARK